MIMETVHAAARPFLDGKTVRDLVVGVSLIACELDTGDIGVSYVLRDGLPNGCSAFPYAQKAVGKPAADIARWILDGRDNLQRAIAASVLAAASQGQDLPDDDEGDRPFGLDVRPEDTVGMIGFIASAAERLSESAGALIVFDQGVSLHGGNDRIYPMNRQAELLPACDIVVLSGTTAVNGSIDGLLELCPKAREVVMVGASTPMFPAGWRGSRITRLAGSWWDSGRKEELFKLVSLACGISHIKNFMIKKTVPVR